ncbi:MAG: PHP domain-containing protein [Steroidobacteraceae bacterium]|jgi:predicted metal-dependent phosphoesterase TrpH
MTADLHLHSYHSDGTLAPAALMHWVAARGVTLAALTDHDTVRGCTEAAQTCAALGIGFVPGVEITAGWQGQELHILGLGIDPTSEALERHLATVRELRHARLIEIGRRLERKKQLVVGEAIEELCSTHDSPTRLHLARLLVERGIAQDIAQAFDHWLGRGQAGYAPAEWPVLETTVKAILEAGGQPVMAHPHRYKISAGALRRLLGEFGRAGGLGMEVSVGGMSSNDFDRLTHLARANGLLGSTGSDFHDPAIPWNPPGRFAKLPPDLEHVAARLQR